MAGDFSQLTPNNNQGLVKAAEGCSTTMASIGLYVRTFNAHDKKKKKLLSSKIRDKRNLSKGSNSTLSVCITHG